MGDREEPEVRFETTIFLFKSCSVPESYRDQDLSVIVDDMMQLGKVLKCDKLDVSAVEAIDPTEQKEAQLLGAFKKRTQKDLEQVEEESENPPEVDKY